MEGAARRSARNIADVVANPDRAEIQPLVGEAIMPVVEPFWRDPFGRALVLGAGERAGAGAGRTGGSRQRKDGAGESAVHGSPSGQRRLTMPSLRMIR